MGLEWNNRRDAGSETNLGRCDNGINLVNYH